VKSQNNVSKSSGQRKTSCTDQRKKKIERVRGPEHHFKKKYSSSPGKGQKGECSSSITKRNEFKNGRGHYHVETPTFFKGLTGW